MNQTPEEAAPKTPPADGRVRGYKKAILTRALGAMRRAISERDVASVKSQLVTLKDVFAIFEMAHDDYHSTLLDDYKVEESEDYFTDVEDDYVAVVTLANTFLNGPDTKSAETQATPETPASSDVTTNMSKMDLHYLSLPAMTIDTFSGDVMHYHEFMAIFDELVDKQPIDDKYKLSRLLQNTKGEARASIRHCSLVGGAQGYQQARKILKERYGNSHVICYKVIEDLKNGKPISNGSDLRALSDDLCSAAETLKELSMSTEIDNQKSIVEICKRCPRYIRLKWKKQALDCMEKHDRHPTFDEFVKFILRMARDSSDPYYGSDSMGSNSKSVEKGASFGTMASNYGNDSAHSQGTNYGSHSGQPKAKYYGNQSSRSQAACVLCKVQHTLFQCDKFKAMNPRDRLAFVKRNRMCYLCLQYGHGVGSCVKTYNCSVPNCGKRHSKYIHIDFAPPGSTPGDTNATTGSESHTEDGNLPHNGSNASADVVDTQIFLPIIPVKVNNDGQTYYALLDSGSTNSFVSETLVSKLKLSKNDANFNISTLSSSSKIDKIVSFDLSSPGGDNKVRLNNVLVVPNIPARYPTTPINIADYPYLSDLNILHSRGNVKTDLLIGMDNANLLMPHEIRSNPNGKNDIYATKTYFGWSICGPVPGNGNTGHVTSMFAQTASTTSIEHKIENLWKLEGNDSDTAQLSALDERVIKLWDEKSYIKQSHYFVPIPWSDGKASLPNNYYMALGRLQSLRKKLERDNLVDRYDEAINKFLNKGYAERVPQDELYLNDGSVFYLPHHHVISTTKDGKLRVVMDCAAKFHGVSLNNQCLGGPDLVNKLLHVLLRFRQYKYAIMADIEGMYMQVKVPPPDSNALRFLWYDSEGKIIQLRMVSHLYGGVWCASSSTYALQRVCRDFECTKLAADVIHKSFYVDDLLRSMVSIPEAVDAMKQTQDVLMCGSFNLTQFVANDERILSEIDPSHRAEVVKDLNLDARCKALGMRWVLKIDKLVYNHKTDPSSKVSRRKVLSKVSSMYDPMGLILPIVIRGRMFFQELTRMKLAWDSEVPKVMERRWVSWLNSLDDLSHVQFDRCLIPDDFVQGAIELVHFCDASQSAYGACSYIRAVNQHARIHTSLIMSRARLAPLKQTTIPRLELCAAVLAVKLDSVIKEQMDVDFVCSTYFTDSLIVLGYIQNQTKRYKTFVQNRTSEIRRLSEQTQWRHIKGKDNPADILSRGCNVSDLPQSWEKGPPFLNQFKCDWPAGQSPTEVPDDEEVIHAHVNSCVTRDSEYVHPVDKLAGHYSSFSRLRNAIAWWLRLRRRLRHGDAGKSVGPFTASELKEAGESIIKHVQRTEFAVEIHCLKQGKPISQRSPIVKLDPTLHEGMMTVGGRLRHARYVPTKHPIILPRHHKVSRMILQDYHNDAHLGSEWTLSVVRDKYWVLGARNTLKYISRNCIKCKKLYGKPAQQKMADLPPERLIPFKRAFSETGFDIFGPYYVKQGRSEVKKYGLVLTCFSTRCIHLELLNSLETDAFINALVRFMARRGRPTQLWCDNATTFVGAKNELARSLKDIQKDKVMQVTNKYGIEWHFNCPTASHHGGVWERLIRSIRKVLSAILNPRARLTSDKLLTLFHEVENIVNGRPLTKVSTDVNDETPLTPNHFLLMCDNISMPLGVFTDSDIYRRSWRHVQLLSNAFWKRWLREYLPVLQLRQKWFQIRDNITEGDIVLIMDENTPRSYWPLGLVTEVIRGRDNLVRSVKLRSRGKVFLRPVTKIVHLEGSK